MTAPTQAGSDRQSQKPDQQQDRETRQDRAEHRRAEAARLHEQLADQVQKLTDSEQWKAFLNFCRSFHTYSVSNTLLVMRQHSTADGTVSGFKAWQAKGRQV
ncbi:MAG: hypothetical protein ACRDQA_09770, partial [Nocardioidaceae bacterium]